MRAWTLVVAAPTALGLMTVPGHAQTVTRCDLNFASSATVAGTLHGNCLEQAIGSSGGALEVCPRANVTSGYDSNAFRTDVGSKGDGFIRASPSLRLRTIGTQFQLRGSVGVTANRQFVQTANSFVDFRANGMIGERLGRDTRVRSIVTFERGHTDRGNIEVAGQTGDLPKFIDSTASAGVTYNPPVGFVSMGQRIRHKRFISDPAGLAAGQDTTTYTSTGCVGTRLSKRIQGVIIGNFSYADRHAGDVSASFNDNYSVSALAQLRYRFTGVTSLAVGAGWLQSKTLEISESATNTFVTRANLAWQPTDLTRVGLVVRNDVKQTNLADAGTLLQRSVGFRVDRSVHPQIDVGLSGEYSTADVRSSDTKAQSLSGQLTISYLANQHALFSFEYRNSRRIGRESAGSFANNSFSLSFSTVY
jgi:hypothetical protein